MLNKMMNDRETYKHLKTNPTAFTSKEFNKFVKDLLYAEKPSRYITSTIQITSNDKRKYTPTTSSFV